MDTLILPHIPWRIKENEKSEAITNLICVLATLKNLIVNLSKIQGYLDKTILSNGQTLQLCS